jgi:predicted DNA-binding transcriptional regulator AlpA
MSSQVIPQYVRAGSIANRRATKTQPARLGLIDISIAHWHRLVAAGIAPRPIKLGGCTMWRMSDVQAFLDSFANGTAKVAA